MENRILDLNLLLLFLTGWEEESRQKPGEKVFRAWKGYLFEVLNRLADEKLIVQYANTKSVTLAEAGKQRAWQLEGYLFYSTLRLPSDARAIASATFCAH